MSAYDPLESNLIGLAPDTPLFRITKLDYVLNDIKCGALTMPRVMSWEDTHEAAYFRTKLLTTANDPASIEESGLDWFGQSWSTQAESDAMWRIYNMAHDSVRLETTAGALLGTLRGQNKNRTAIRRVVASFAVPGACQPPRQSVLHGGDEPAVRRLGLWRKR